MPITVLSDVILPNSIISAGVRGKNQRMNARLQTDNGFDSINVVWTSTVRQYEIGTVPLLVAQWQAIETLHEITEGGAFGFLMEDPKDNSTTNGVVTEVSAGVYRLHKRYLDGVSGRYKDRAITRPRAAGLVLSTDGPIDPSEYTLDPETGLITYIPGQTSLHWSGRFMVPVHFQDDFIDWSLQRAGTFDQRLLCGPSVVLVEVKE